MKKFKFHLSTSSDDEPSNSDASDDEMPEINVPSQIITEQPKKGNDKLTKEHRNSDNSNGNHLLKESNEKDSNAKNFTYKSYLAERTKSLLEAFPSDSDEEESKNLNTTNNKDKTKSSLISNDPENIKNYDSSSETDEKQEQDTNSNQISHDQNQIPNIDKPNSRIVNMHLEVPKIPPGQRQKKLMNSIKTIYDFFDHKISVQSIIYAIHDHAGMLKDAVATLNKYPNKYDDYSLHNMPSNANQVEINSYLRILK